MAARQFRVMISFRVKEASQEAETLALGLEAHGISTFICTKFLRDGEDMKKMIINVIDQSELVVILGTATYGKETLNTYSTHEELKFIISEKKKIFLVQMCDRFEEASTRFNLPDSIKSVKWNLRSSIPADLIERVATSLKENSLRSSVSNITATLAIMSLDAQQFFFQLLDTWETPEFLSPLQHSEIVIGKFRAALKLQYMSAFHGVMVLCVRSIIRAKPKLQLGGESVKILLSVALEKSRDEYQLVLDKLIAHRTGCSFFLAGVVCHYVFEKYDQAYKHYLVSANKHNFYHANYLLGVCYSLGEGVEVDFSNAFQNFLLAAKEEHAHAQYNVGVYFYKGKGTTLNVNESKKWIMAAYAQQSVDANVAAQELGFL